MLNLPNSLEPNYSHNFQQQKDIHVINKSSSEVRKHFYLAHRKYYYMG
jgi:Zn-dependent peptidase ImmA (M78 family)